MLSEHSAWLHGVGRGCEIASAIFGIIGTGLMSRRFCPQLGRSVFYALTWPFLIVIGKGQRARDFFAARASINWNNPDSPADMTLGLNLLFWAFLLQLISLLWK
jgi:hypothetical protein